MNVILLLYEVILNSDDDDCGVRLKCKEIDDSHPFIICRNGACIQLMEPKKVETPIVDWLETL